MTNDDVIPLLGIKHATISIRVKHVDGTVTDYGVVSESGDDE
jgi:hypothetical protein